MTIDELRSKCSHLAPAGDAMAAAVLRLLIELEGFRKANAMLLAGMGSVCEGRDELKHRVRELETRDELRVQELRDTDDHLARANERCRVLTERVRELEALVRSLSERCAGQSELLSARAEKPSPLPPGQPAGAR
jgi:chromosome segregation ATPase